MADRERKDIDHLVHTWPDKVSAEHPICFFFYKQLKAVDGLGSLAGSIPIRCRLCSGRPRIHVRLPPSPVAELILFRDPVRLPILSSQEILL